MGYARWPGIDKPEKRRPVECHRCFGNGFVHTYGVCFRCGGVGTDPTDRGYFFPTEWTDAEIEAWEDDRAARNARARDRAAERKLAKRDAKWAENLARYPDLAGLPAYVANGASRFVSDVFEKAHRFDLSEKQAAAVVKILTDDAIAKIAEAERIAASTSTHLGSVGEKITVTGEVTFRKAIDSHYGVSVLIVLTDADGNEVKFFSTAQWVWDVVVGDRITVTATVKDHDEYGGIRQTLVKRPRLDATLVAVG